MECMQHKGRDAIGYCHVCGEFGCAECLTEYGGQLYCSKDIRPIIVRLEQEHAQNQTPQERRMLVAHRQDGGLAYGYSLHLNAEERGFYVEEVNPRVASVGAGTTKYIPFEGLKAVFLVRSFDGKGSGSADGPPTVLIPQGEDIVVRFRDGETLRGRAWQAGKVGPPRFVVLPEDPDCNNMAVLVEWSAVVGVYTPEQYRERLHQELRDFLVNHTHDGLSKDEVTGDFFFRHHDYSVAIEHYRRLSHLAPRSPRIRKKLISAEFKVASEYTRRHDYENALICLTRIIDMDPTNEKVKEKRRLLQKAYQKSLQKQQQAQA